MTPRGCPPRYASWEPTSHSRDCYKVRGESRKTPSDYSFSRCNHPLGSKKREITDMTPWAPSPTSILPSQ